MAIVGSNKKRLCTPGENHSEHFVHRKVVISNQIKSIINKL